ncbi:hypothetical protein LJC56_01585 [Christensenellaceae bacterium OttesenSCG-928-K19]|nr:hypothetical protein [Christensenellaceae bacterium OttesenSCG-928-K19]
MVEMRGELIASCGLNCRVCETYQVGECTGCRPKGKKPERCMQCYVRCCPTLEETQTGFCLGCELLPCREIKYMDGTYQQDYGVSPLNNLSKIQRSGMAQFLAQEELKWYCPHCKSVTCMQSGVCPACGKPWR